MAVKLAKVGGEKKKVVELPDTDLGNPTTQVKMSAKPTTRYDPLATVSIMDQMKTSSTTTAKTKRLPVIGHLPMAKQIQMLGLLLIAFLALAVLMLYLDGRTASQQAASFATAMDMQMLSQRVARSSMLAAQGQPGALPAARESRERFTEDLNAFLNGGTVRGVSLGAATDPSQTEILQSIKTRWERGPRRRQRAGDRRCREGQRVGKRWHQRPCRACAAGRPADAASRWIGARRGAGIATRDARAANRQERRHVDFGGRCRRRYRRGPQQG